MIGELYFTEKDGKKAPLISRQILRETLENIPEVKTLSESLNIPVKESFDQQILRHLETVQSGTINKSDMTNALLQTC
jgi:hypothetical protein